MNTKILEIVRKGRTKLVTPIKVRDLDKSKCSTKFLEHNFDPDYIVNVKCDENGILDLRGKREEYRIIVEDKDLSK